MGYSLSSPIGWGKCHPLSNPSNIDFPLRVGATNVTWLTVCALKLLRPQSKLTWNAYIGCLTGFTSAIYDAVRVFRLVFQEHEQVQITPIIIQCKSIHMNIWASLFYAYKGLLLVSLRCSQTALKSTTNTQNCGLQSSRIINTQQRNLYRMCCSW